MNQQPEAAVTQVGYRSQRKPRLELVWIDKDRRPRLDIDGLHCPGLASEPDVPDHLAGGSGVRSAARPLLGQHRKRLPSAPRAKAHLVWSRWNRAPAHQGRGLRLSYGKRTGVAAVDRLNIVAHDRFQEIVDETRKADSPIRLTEVLLSAQPGEKAVLVVSRPLLASSLGLPSEGGLTAVGIADAAPIFSAVEQAIAICAYEAIRRLETRPGHAPTTGSLRRPEVLATSGAALETTNVRDWPGMIDSQAGSDARDSPQMPACIGRFVLFRLF